MKITCPRLHTGRQVVMYPDGEGEWVCRECGTRFYRFDDGTICGPRPPEITDGHPLGGADLLKPGELRAWVQSLLGKGHTLRQIAGLTGRPYGQIHHAINRRRARSAQGGR